MKNLNPVQQMVGILTDVFIYGNVERRIYSTSCGAGYFWTLHTDEQETAVSDNRIYDWPSYASGAAGKFVRHMQAEV